MGDEGEAVQLSLLEYDVYQCRCGCVVHAGGCAPDIIKHQGRNMDGQEMASEESRVVEGEELDASLHMEETREKGCFYRDRSSIGKSCQRSTYCYRQNTATRLSKAIARSLLNAGRLTNLTSDPHTPAFKAINSLKYGERSISSPGIQGLSSTTIPIGGFNCSSRPFAYFTYPVLDGEPTLIDDEPPGPNKERLLEGLEAH